MRLTFLLIFTWVVLISDCFSEDEFYVNQSVFLSIKNARRIVESGVTKPENNEDKFLNFTLYPAVNFLKTNTDEPSEVFWMLVENAPLVSLGIESKDIDSLMKAKTIKIPDEHAERFFDVWFGDLFYCLRLKDPYSPLGRLQSRQYCNHLLYSCWLISNSADLNRNKKLKKSYATLTSKAKLIAERILLKSDLEKITPTPSIVYLNKIITGESRDAKELWEGYVKWLDLE